MILGFSLDNWGEGGGLYFLIKQSPDRKLHVQTEGALTSDLVCQRVDEPVPGGALQRKHKSLGMLVLSLFLPADGVTPEPLHVEQGLH